MKTSHCRCPSWLLTWEKNKGSEVLFLGSAVETTEAWKDSELSVRNSMSCLELFAATQGSNMFFKSINIYLVTRELWKRRLNFLHAPDGPDKCRCHEKPHLTNITLITSKKLMGHIASVNKRVSVRQAYYISGIVPDRVLKFHIYGFIIKKADPHFFLSLVASLYISPRTCSQPSAHIDYSPLHSLITVLETH